jgi:phospholipase/carboxylesterase
MKTTISTKNFSFEFQPASARIPRSEQRLMIVLHGRGDSLRPFRELREELRIPGMNYLLLNAPRKYDGGYSWYAFPPNQKNGILKSRAKLLSLMDELQEQGWNSREIFFFGFSQGCLMSVDMGLHFTQPLAGIIGVSGYVYFFRNWKKTLPSAAFHTPWLMTHGIFDDALGIGDTRGHVKQMHSVGLPILWKEFNKDHEIDQEIEAPMIRNWILARMPKGRAATDNRTSAKPNSKYPLENQPRSARDSAKAGRPATSN